MHCLDTNQDCQNPFYILRIAATEPIDSPDTYHNYVRLDRGMV